MFEEYKGNADSDLLCSVLGVMWTVMGMGAENPPNLENVK